MQFRAPARDVPAPAERHHLNSSSGVRRIAWALGLLCLWSAGYFGAPLVAGQTAVFDPSLPLDFRLPCVPALVNVYVLGLATPFVPALLLPWHLFLRSVLAYALLIAAATLAFVILPTDGIALRSTCPAHWALGMLHDADVQSNLFPSLHVGFSTLAALCLRSARSRWATWLFGMACLQAIAVCLIKQHYLADAAAGPLFAWAAHRVAYAVPR